MEQINLNNKKTQGTGTYRQRNITALYVYACDRFNGKESKYIERKR